MPKIVIESLVHGLLSNITLGLSYLASIYGEKGYTMKKLSMFTIFDWPSFAKGKRFACVGCSEWKNFDTGAHMGTKVEAAIIEDTTDYGEDSGTVTNLFEKLTFKVRKDISVPVGIEIRPKDVQCTVYGDYRNLLSCTAEDIIFQQAK